MSQKLKILVCSLSSASEEDAALSSEFLAGQYDTLELRQIPLEISPSVRGLAGLGMARRAISALKKARAEFQPDVLLFPMGSGGSTSFFWESVILTATRRLFPGLVLHLHGSQYQNLVESRTGLRRWFFRKAFDQPDLAISSNRATSTEAAAFNPIHSVLVHAGISDVWPEGLSPWQIEPPQILFLGPLTEAKGVGVLIEACKILAGSKFKFRCLLAGPSEPGQLEAWKAQAAGLEGVLSFSGPLSGNARWQILQKSDIVCYPSQCEEETYSLSVMQAIMAGLPVVTTKWRELPDLVLDGKTGFLVPGDDAKTTANRLGRLVGDSILRQIMGNSARNRFLEHFTAEKFRGEMEGAFALLPQSRPETPA